MPRESTIQILRSTTTDVPTGLTFGEIAYSDLNGKLFVGDNLGNSRWMGGEVTSGTISTNSPYLVPTQSAVKTYVDGIVGGGSVVNSINGTGGNITITGDSQSQRVTVSGTTTTFTNRLATTSATGVASFDPSFFSVGTSGHVRFSGETGDTLVQGTRVSITKSGKAATINVDVPLASLSATGVAQFGNGFDVDGSGKVTLAAGGVSNTALANSCIIIRDEAGVTDAICLGETLTITGGRGVDFLRTGTDTYQISGVTATSSVLGVASFNSTRFSVVNGAVDLTTPYQITGDTVAGVGSVSVTRSGNNATIDNRLASTSVTGVASFNSVDFTVSSGAVSLQSNIVKAASSVASVNGATGAITITGDAGSQQVSVSGTTTTITNRLATTSVTGVASFSSSNFDVAAGAVSLKNNGVPNTALANSSFVVSAGSNNTIALGGTLTLTGTANQVSVSSNGSGTVTLGLPNDITIPGNLTVNGTVVTANVDTFAVKDPLITLGTGNAADSLDLGFYGRYVSSGTRFAGLFRDASDSGKFKLFAGLTAEPTTIVDNSQSSFAIATLIAKVDGGTF